MQLPSLLSPPLLVLLLFSSILLLLLKRRRKHAKLPPGPWKLPFIGSLHQLLTGEHTHRLFHRLAEKHGPLFNIKLGQVDFVVASSPSIAREVLSTHDHSLDYRPTIEAIEMIGYHSGGIGFSPYGAYWRQLRKICTQELLSMRKVKAFDSIRREEALKVLEDIRMAAGSPVNLTKMIRSLTNMHITRTAVGKECASSQRFLTVMKEANKVLTKFRVADLFPSLSSLISFVDGSRFQMKRLSREMDAVLDEIIAEHQARKGVTDEMDEDMVDVLLRIQKEGDLQVPLTMDNVKAIILDILVAATETTSNTMCWIMAELMCNPDVMRKAQSEIREVFKEKIKIEDSDIKELHYLRKVIKETLRMHSPLPLLLPRTNPNEAKELLGFSIPHGARVMVNAWAIAMDPSIWKDPERFLPERFEGQDFQRTSYEYIPFGAGRRICPGMTFAMAGIELFFALLLSHFDWQMPDGCRELDMEDEFDGILIKKNDIFLIAIPHGEYF